MARQQRFDWFVDSQKSCRKNRSRRSHSGRWRRPCFEALEPRTLLSANSAEFPDQLELASVGSSPFQDGGSDSYWASEELYNLYGVDSEFVAITPWVDADPVADGIQITYSYSNFLSGVDPLPGGLSEEDLRAATEEALGLWATYAPLHFIEIPDAGPGPSDVPYSPVDLPSLRIGHHLIDGGGSVLAHAYFPQLPPTGLAGDVHFDTGDNWSLDPGFGEFDILEVMTHELGHSLGLGHETVVDAIMNPFYSSRFSGLGTGFLLQDDIDGIQALYGPGVGSVTPLGPLVVDTLMDESDDNFDEGDLSLREAVEIASATGQTISFAEELAGGTILLDSTLGSLSVTGPLTIEGLGADQITVVAPTPDGSLSVGGDGQIFVISYNDPEETLPVEISGIALTGANSVSNGGAIYTEHNLILRDVDIHHNETTARGGAVYSLAKLETVSSTMANNVADNDGGAIYTEGGVKIDSSTLSDNSSGDEGGAIAAAGELTRIELISSTISGNQAVGDGGGLHVVDPNPTVFRFRHSTIFDNHSSTGSGGGAYIYGGVLVLEHTILAGNSDVGEAPDVDNINLAAAPVVLARHSIIGSDEGSTITEVAPNLIGTSGAPVDPMLASLEDNGGPTKTHKPLLGSPAIDAGDPEATIIPAFDQRGTGFDRVAFDVIDIGSFESTGFALTFTVDTLVDENDGVFSSGDLSLREAIMLSSNEPGTDLINFSSSLSGGTISLNSSLGELVVDAPMSIDAGDLAVGLTINASATDPTPLVNNGDGTRVVRVDDGSAATQIDVSFEGITFTGGDVSGDGGAIHSQENLSLRFISVLGNSASNDGGGIFHKDGALVIENTTVANNEAGQDGGGLFNNTNIAAPVTGRITQSTFSGNDAGDEGGGIFNFDGLLEIELATITENSALLGGGVVSYGDASTQTSVFGSIIAGNTGLDVQRSRNLGYNSFVSGFYNLIGFGSALVAFESTEMDLTEVADPMLSSLASNGGKTMTHLPLPGSPAIDAGDPTVTDPEFDQRGAPFDRVNDGDGDSESIIDIGAVEVPQPEPDADFNEDGSVDGDDFLAWQRGVGKSSGAIHSDGDSDHDEDVDSDDLANWEDAYGTVNTMPLPLASLAEPARSEENVVDMTTSSDRTTRMPIERLGRDLVALAAHRSLFADWGEDSTQKVAEEASHDFSETVRSRVILHEFESSLAAFHSTRVEAFGRLLKEPGCEDRTDVSWNVDLALERLADFGLRGT